MKKFLYFRNSTTDSLMLAADNLIGLEVDTNSDNVTFTFQDEFDGPGGSTIPHVTITAKKGREVMEAISQEIRHGKQAFITVADDVDKIYLNSDITSANAVQL